MQWNSADGGGAAAIEDPPEVQFEGELQFDEQIVLADPQTTRRPFQSNRIRRTDVLLFTSQLAIVCRSGVDLAEGLREAVEGCRHPGLRPMLEDIYHQVSNGVPVSVAMRRHEEVLGGAYVGSIAAAESSGNVPEVLSRLSDMLRNEIRMRSSLISTLTYPIALMGIASLVLLALVFFVLPQFGTVFENMGKTPPPFTQFLLHTSAIARAYWPWLLGGAVMSGILAWQFSRTPQSREVLDNFVLNFSMLRGDSRALLAGRTFRLLGMMLESGVTLLDAVRLCQDSVSNSLYRKLFLKLEQQVLSGSGIASTISATEYLPMGVAQMVRTAERTGRLGSVLEMIGHYYEEEGERQLRQFVKLLEPVIIMVMGIVVAGIVSSIMLPLLDVSTMSH